jgi:Zn-dependent metalloprotease
VHTTTMSRRGIRATALALATVLAAPAVAEGPAAAAPAPAPAPPADAARAAAERVLAEEPARIHRAPDDTFVFRAVTAGARGLHYVSYDRVHAGLPVRGGDIVVVTDAAGAVRHVNLTQEAPLSVSTTPTLPTTTAVATARAEVTNPTTNTSPALIILANGTGQLVYEIVVTGQHDGEPVRRHVYVDAHTGDMRGGFDELQAATGRSHYHGTVTFNTTFSGTRYGMADPQRPGLRCGGQDGRTFTSTTDVWGNGGGADLVTACVDAMYAAAAGWDMLADWLDRDGYDGHGRGFPMRVGLDDANAYWTGYEAWFGHNGLGTRQATPTDVVVHELGHAIFQHTPGGVGGNVEAPALNESTGDIFGTLAEWYMNESTAHDPPDYLMGEEVSFFDEGPVRNMFNPSALGDPNCYFPLVGWIEPHAAAGVQNHWFYLLAEGSAPKNPAGGTPGSPTCDGRPVQGIGIERAGLIFMETLNRKQNLWHWWFARYYSMQAAHDLFPEDCTVVTRVGRAWDAVNVPRRYTDEPVGC